MSKSSRKSFAIIAIIVGAAGIGIGAYTIATIGADIDQSLPMPTNPSSESALHPSALNGSPVLGSLDAPITVVEFGDYQCSKCQRFALQTKPLIIENYINTGKAQLVFKDFTVYGSDSINGAIATHCAAEQNMFWELHNYLYQNQKAINSGWLSAENIRNFTLDLGLNMAQFNKCFDERKYLMKVTKNFEEGRSIGVSGTPTFIIIGPDGQSTRVSGAQPFKVFQQVLDKMLVG
ncbi:MAG: DsbA family protein [Nitrososphaerales archaeon]